ncbi:dromaiocalcin-1-like [Varanus komodoensis]|uniref:C-type lectin domain-containing protein n=1 Tax=Varanus komodoensis TaxID=61221 RepID=A0A8D2LVW5_VARKO|nr:dromaiocalcin-1-like [Varanus komodoensis]
MVTSVRRPQSLLPRGQGRHLPSGPIKQRELAGPAPAPWDRPLWTQAGGDGQSCESRKMGPMAYFSMGLVSCLVGGHFLGGAAAEPCRAKGLSRNGRCYLYFPEEVTWPEAQAQCRRSRGHLVSILDLTEHKFVARYLRQVQGSDDEDVWLGISVPPRSRRWAWADGSRVAYTAWEEPQSYWELDGDHCALLEESSGFMLWEKESCFDKNPFLCKV